MPKFKGKNTIKKASTLGIERAKWNKTAFPENNGMGPKQILDFNFAERRLYGKVDRQHNPVTPDYEYIDPISTMNDPNSIVLAMNFVADQFAAFEAHFARACKSGLLQLDDAIFSSIKAVRGYEDPYTSYKQYADRIIRSYSENFLKARMKQIKNFDDYLNNFLEFMEKMGSDFPLTLSGFQRSIHSSIFSSGLAIDIAGVSYHDDDLKQLSLLDSPSFQFYKNLAIQYGFSIDKRVPSILVSDMDSPATAKFLGYYDLTSIGVIFSTQFEKTLFRDLDLLKNLLIDDYNFLASRYRLRKEIKTCGKKTTGRLFERPNAHDININNLIVLYINIRNIEENKPFTEKEINNISSNSKRIYNISQQKALNYIDDQFKSKYNFKDGTLTYHLDRNKVRKKT